MSATVSAAVLRQVERQHWHWAEAVRRLAQPDNLASESSWASLEQHLGTEIKQHLDGLTVRLKNAVEDLGIRIARADTPAALDSAHQALLRFRHQYQKTETTLDFFADAITTRTNVETSCLLRACDIIAQRAMAAVLDPLNLPTPSVLTYLDKGLGAAILKQGLRLWDGGESNPVAAIRLVRHNILRPTSLIHEAGHQVAHILGWNEALAESLNKDLRANGVAPEICDLWSGWASELAADALSFSHTGYASVATLHDVVADRATAVFRYLPGDPHPISYLRVRFGINTCRYFYGKGPWDELEEAFVETYPLHGHASNDLITAALSAFVPTVDAIYLRKSRAFRGRSLSDLLPPERVSPSALTAMEQHLGDALFNSSYWIWTESLRVIALTGLRLSGSQSIAKESIKRQQQVMNKLGALKA